MHINRLCASALLLIAATACAGGSSSASGSAATAEAPKSNPDVLTAAEIAADPSTAGGDALQAVQRMRPRFLMARGTVSGKNTTAGSVHISVDGGPLSSIDNLSRYAASSVIELRYINSTDAAQRWGTAAGTGGVIIVKSK